MLDKSSDMQVRIPNKRPLFVLIQVDNPKHTPWPNLPNDVHPIGMYLILLINFLYIILF
jgi:hypothetical protein